MNDASRKIRRILDEYFAGSLSDALEGRIRGWLIDDPHRAEKDEALEALWEARVDYQETPGRYARTSIEALASRLGFPRRRAALGWRGILGRAAAVLIPLAVVGGTVLWYVGRQPVQWVTLTADAGVQEQIVLPDGSRLWLDPNGEVSYPEKFREREVKLTGEAFFDVAADKRKPFTVSTNGMTVVVHGTRFQVAAYEEKDRATVTLHSGSVEVETAAAETVLEPGDRLQYDRDEETVRVEEVVLGEWGKPELDFYDAGLEEIFFSLEQNYGVELTFDGAVPEAPRYTIRFTPEQPIDEVLQILADLTRSFTSEAEQENQIEITFVPRT